jgi:uncharacterized protein (TIGR02246 family)
MRFICSLVMLVVISIRSFSQEGMIYNKKDSGDLKLLPEKWEKYWNKHNMDSLSTMLTEDVDFVNLAGVWLKGKTASIQLLRLVHQTTFKSSIWITDSVKIRYVKPDLAILHIGWGLSGDVDPDGTNRIPKHGLFTWVVIKEKEQWKLLAIDNVNIK